jgi:hypothetical protein
MGAALGALAVEAALAEGRAVSVAGGAFRQPKGSRRVATTTGAA